MANFSFTVDTQEMANSIEGVSSHVNTVTTAVVAMQSAVVAAEVAAANRVCKHVDNGFFSLIRSQITQKIARLRSEVDSHLIEMRQQSQALAGIKTRMERDYQMVAARYTKVFRSIDLSLRNRVFELDKAVSNLVNREIERIQLRMRALQAQVPVHQLETVQTAQAMAASQTKLHAQRAIQGMQSFLTSSSRQAILMESMLFEGVSAASDFRYVPVLLVGSDSTSVGGEQWGIRAPGGGAKRMADAVEAGAQNIAFAALPSMKWTAPDAESQTRVAAEFRRLTGQPGLDEKLQGHMLRLFEASPWQVIERGRA
jgi:hypothetical protein